MSPDHTALFLGGVVDQSFTWIFTSCWCVHVNMGKTMGNQRKIQRFVVGNHWGVSWISSLSKKKQGQSVKIMAHFEALEASFQATLRGSSGFTTELLPTTPRQLTSVKHIYK